MLQGACRLDSVQAHSAHGPTNVFSETVRFSCLRHVIAKPSFAAWFCLVAVTTEQFISRILTKHHPVILAVLLTVEKDSLKIESEKESFNTLGAMWHTTRLNIS